MQTSRLYVTLHTFRVFGTDYKENGSASTSIKYEELAIVRFSYSDYSPAVSITISYSK